MMTATETKTRPILFNGEMVRAILDGRKTMTRRIVKPQTEFGYMQCAYCPSGWGERTESGNGCRCTNGATIGMPPAHYGEKLWVRETWRASWDGDFTIDVNYSAGDQMKRFYTDSLPDKATSDYVTAWEWRPSIHMPRWASRITLEVTDVRAERLQEISWEDAEAEGIERLNHPLVDDGFVVPECIRGVYPPGSYQLDPTHIFRNLWDSINGKGEHDWASNPWVWVVGFTRIDS